MARIFFSKIKSSSTNALLIHRDTTAIVLFDHMIVLWDSKKIFTPKYPLSDD